HLHITILIVENDNLKNPELNLTEDNLQVSDDDIQDTENEWIEAINHENRFNYSDNKILLTDKINDNFNFGGKIIHLANDLAAKWLLASLFVFDLKSPTYLGIGQIYSAL
ncbi:18665_t:CDS:2, partial [Funneliformis geosporum]